MRLDAPPPGDSAVDVAANADADADAGDPRAE